MIEKKKPAYGFKDTFAKGGNSRPPDKSRMVRQAAQTNRNKRIKVTLPSVPWKEK